ncbi:MAG TPA: aromatic amino acid ammonia-lyase, partial [Bryobacteraceae bacterium]|nr:aromatic amino acid ammonia-lyase [Bryobacteraceae bacterium]
DVLFNGDRTPAAYAFRVAGLRPLTPEHREALAFVNGTSAMTAIAALNASDAQRALHLAMRNTVLYAELMEGQREAFDPRFAEVRPHAGQQWATAELNRLCADSRRLQGRKARFVRPEMFRSSSVSPGNLAPQDPYTIRCAPQIFGAIADVLTFHKTIVEVELNSVTDNPIFLDDEVLHGGNFYGQHVAFASDALMTAIVKMAVHSERRIARITDESLNRGLPAFLHVNQPGLHSGFMGVQLTASGIVAEMRSKCVPASIQSIPTSANNQDVVSMGTMAARRTAELIDHLYDLLAIEALVMVQGLDICDGFEGPDFAKSSCKLALFVRNVSPFLGYDRPLHSDIAQLSARLRTSAAF